MAKHVKQSVLPIYGVGASWLAYAMFSSLRTPREYVVCTAASLVVFLVGKAILPDKSFEMPEQAQPKAAEKPKPTGNPEIDALLVERERALSEMHRLNDSIADQTISDQIDHLEEVTRKIIDQVIQEPKKLSQIRRFLEYYLPTTLKILNAYDRMDSIGASGENIDTTKGKVEQMMVTIVHAYDKQLDALFGEDALDISTDITVMENLLAREGLGGFHMQQAGDDPKLEL